MGIVTASVINISMLGVHSQKYAPCSVKFLSLKIKHSFNCTDTAGELSFTGHENQTNLNINASE